jgi:hypothetical protein
LKPRAGDLGAADTQRVGEVLQEDREGHLLYGDHFTDGRRIGPAVERILDAPGDPVDRLRVLANRVQRAVFAPAGDVGDRLAADVETG